MNFPAGEGSLLPPPPEGGEAGGGGSRFPRGESGALACCFQLPRRWLPGRGRRGRSWLHPRAGGGPSTAPTCRRAGGSSPARPLSARGRASPRLRPGHSRQQPLHAAPVLDCSLLAARATSSGILEHLLSRVPFHLSQSAPLSYLQPFLLPPPLLPCYLSFSPPLFPIFFFFGGVFLLSFSFFFPNPLLFWTLFI